MYIFQMVYSTEKRMPNFIQADSIRGWFSCKQNESEILWKTRKSWPSCEKQSIRTIAKVFYWDSWCACINSFLLEEPSHSLSLSLSLFSTTMLDSMIWPTWKLCCETFNSCIVNIQRTPTTKPKPLNKSCLFSVRCYRIIISRLNMPMPPDMQKLFKIALMIVTCYE